jgi:hypothetical protein
LLSWRIRSRDSSIFIVSQLFVVVEIGPATGAKRNPDYKALLAGIQAAVLELQPKNQLVAQR